MQFHHRGYESQDPRIRPSEGRGRERTDGLPPELDVLIVGTGPAGMLLAAQLSRFPKLNVRIIEKRPGRLEIGQADGIQARTVETFQAFGFANRIIDEAYRITETCFWKPDPENPRNIVRTARVPDDPAGLSEFPHLVVNQARVLDYFAEAAQNAPGRIKPDYGIEFLSLSVREGEYPVAAKLRHTCGEHEGAEFTVRAKYVVGADGARSGVRKAIGRSLRGDAAMHAWGVLDVLATSDFPDIRIKSAIQSHDGGNILLIPREGEYLFRVYVDLGDTGDEDPGAIRQTPVEEIISRANNILNPYSIEGKSIAWWSVYEVAHRLADGFDDVPEDRRGTQAPRVFIMGDACHTHSAKAGQGMNVSMQDAFNLGWKLAATLEGRAPESLLDTYAEERKAIAEDLIAFDKEWSSLMAKRAEEMEDPTELERFYEAGFEFTNGFKTEYPESLLVMGTEHQDLAKGFPIGKRFKSAEVVRNSDSNIVHLGHLFEADGRWRVYAFADSARPAANDSKLRNFAEWLRNDPASPVARYTRPGEDDDSTFDVKVVYQQDYRDVEPDDVPTVFKPTKRPFDLVDLNKIFATGHGTDIFSERGISRDGCLVVVRPDMYVAAVLPLDRTTDLAKFMDTHMLPS